LEEEIASIIRLKRLTELETTLAVTSNTANVVSSSLILFILMMEAVYTRSTRSHSPADGIQLRSVSEWTEDGSFQLSGRVKP
jgi:hypothetical protein